MRMFRTESYTLMPGAKAEAYKELGVGDTEPVPKVDLFSNDHNASKSLNCTKMSSTWKYHWEKVGLCYANPPFSCMLKAVVKTVLDKARLLYVFPDWTANGVDRDWRALLDHLTVKRVYLPDEPLYIKDHALKPTPKPRWRSMMTLIDGKVNKVEKFVLGSVTSKFLQSRVKGWGMEELIKNQTRFPLTFVEGPRPELEEVPRETTTPPIQTPAFSIDTVTGTSSFCTNNCFWEEPAFEQPMMHAQSKFTTAETMLLGITKGNEGLVEQQKQRDLVRGFPSKNSWPITRDDRELLLAKIQDLERESLKGRFKVHYRRRDKDSKALPEVELFYSLLERAMWDEPETKVPPKPV